MIIAGLCNHQMCEGPSEQLVWALPSTLLTVEAYLELLHGAGDGEGGAVLLRVLCLLLLGLPRRLLQHCLADLQQQVLGGRGGDSSEQRTAGLPGSDDHDDKCDAMLSVSYCSYFLLTVAELVYHLVTTFNCFLVLYSVFEKGKFSLMFLHIKLLLEVQRDWDIHCTATCKAFHNFSQYCFFKKCCILNLGLYFAFFPLFCSCQYSMLANNHPAVFLWGTSS